MKVFCGLLVLLAVVAVSQSKSVRYRERLSIRTPFYLRQRPGVAPSIVGGQPADIADFPHHLGLLDLSFGGYICGASVISTSWSLSAAHCLEFEVPATSINLWGGSTSRLTGGTVFFVAEYTLHPQYNGFTLDNDVALLRVDPNSLLQGVPNVSPIAIPDNCDSLCCGVCTGGDPITVTGWGVTDGGALPVNLLQVQKPIHDHADCDRIWGEISEQMFCTTAENGSDSCNGDSGGAIIRSGTQVGVVSFGSEVCGDGSAPAVYVRVEAPLVRNWIRQLSGV